MSWDHNHVDSYPLLIRRIVSKHFFLFFLLSFLSLFVVVIVVLFRRDKS